MYNKLGSYRNDSLLSNTEGSHRQTIRILVWHWFWVPPLRYTIQTWNRTQSTRHQCFLQTQHIPWKTRYHMVICLGTWKWYKKCLYSALGQHIIWLHCIFYCLNFFNSHILVGSAIFTLLQCSITGHTNSCTNCVSITVEKYFYSIYCFMSNIVNKFLPTSSTHTAKLRTKWIF